MLAEALVLVILEGPVSRPVLQANPWFMTLQAAIGAASSPAPRLEIAVEAVLAALAQVHANGNPNALLAVRF